MNSMKTRVYSQDTVTSMPGTTELRGTCNLAITSRGYEHLYKLLFIGDSGVGKTSLIWRFSDNSFNNAFIHTIGGYFCLHHHALT